MGTKGKMPPVMNDDTDYQCWVNDVKVWSLFTDLDKKKMGPAIYLSLEGKAREVVREMDTEKLASDTGYGEIIKVLDTVYLKDKNTRSYLAFKTFYNFKRTSGMSIIEFITLFEKYYADMKKYEMVLPDAVLAFMLLNAANISEENEKLARATIADLTYENMKTKILRIFAENSDSNEGAPEVKVEPADVFYTRYQSTNQRGIGNGNQRGRGGRARYQRTGFRGNQRRQDERGISESNEEQRSRLKCYICQSADHLANRCPQNNRLKCFVCQSTAHFANRCPSRTDRNSADEQVHYTLISSKECNDLSTLVGDTLGMALLDSGCTKTVVGEKWLKVYEEMLSDEDRVKVCFTNDYSTFRFGDGAQVVSTKQVNIPAVIGNKQIQIKANVVDNNIPLLMSRESMKRADTTINFCNDKATILGQDIKLYSSKFGHYCLPLSPMVGSIKSMSSIVLHVSNVFMELSREDKKQKAKKLHRQFAHPTDQRLIKLLKGSKGFKEDKELLELITEVSNECHVCEEFKKPKSRPVVGMPLATQFNEVVCMDLKEYIHNKIWILHFIDAFTRKSNAVLIKTKKDTEIIKQVYSQWIKHYGCPKKLLTDNGGEFANEKYREMNEKLNVETCKTAAESPFSNGIVERHNLILYECFKKVLNDTKCEPDVALGWAVAAKNSLHNNNGYSSDQLVYGRNSNFPTVLNDELPALESSTHVDVIRVNMNAMHKAREAFIENESSERIRRALRCNVRTYSDEVYANGDKVFYRRRNYKGWKGPATVLGKDGQCVLVRHGSIYCRVHPCHLMKRRSVQTLDHLRKKDETGQNLQASIAKQVPVIRKTTRQRHLQANHVTWKDQEIGNDEIPDEDVTFQDDEDAEPPDEEVDESQSDEDAEIQEVDVDESQSDEDAEIQGVENVEIPDEDGEFQEVEIESPHEEVEFQQVQVDEFQGDEDSEQGIVVEEMDKSNVNKNDIQSCGAISDEITIEWPRNKATIQFLEDKVWKTALVLSRQPKRKGKYKDWLNIHVTGEEQPRSIDWSQVVAWKKMPDVESVLLLNSDEHLDQPIIDAKLKELENLKEHNVYEEVNIDEIDSGRCISTRWVVTEKCSNGEKIIKARLVARGFEEDTTQMVKDSPTCTKESLRLVYTVAATKHWPIQSLDISSAFLQGNKIQRDVYVMPPEDVRTEGVIWKLRRSIYGLSDAPRAWYDKVKAEMKSLGATVSKFDNSLFMWHKGNEIVGILVSHVDDFTFAGTKDWESKVIGALKRKFKISACHTNSFKYLGLSVEQANDEIMISQEKYVSDMKPISISAARKRDINQPLNIEEKKQLKALSGQMLWVTNHTRPDMSFESCAMSNVGKNPTIKKLLDANKAVQKLKSKNLSLKLCGIDPSNEIEVECYTDATHASLGDGSSQGAYIVGIKGKKGLIPISWQSKKLNRITKSPIASEAAALCDGADAAYLVSATLKEIFPNRIVRIICRTDNKSLVETLKTTKVHADKRLRVDVSRLKEMIVEEEVMVEWVRGQEQLADGLTKRGASTDLLVEALRM